jgi:hypothetical protein
MIHKKCSPGRIRIYLLFAVALALSIPASAAWKEKVLYSFQGGMNDGSLPVGGVVFDKKGNLYGATYSGMVYQLVPPLQKSGAWTENVVYVFQGVPKGDVRQSQWGLSD